MTKTVLAEQVLPAIHQHHVGCHFIRNTTNLCSVMKDPSEISYGHLHRALSAAVTSGKAIHTLRRWQFLVLELIKTRNVINSRMRI
jgi:hypothetical protein